jgi:uncharacterized membrane protein
MMVTNLILVVKHLLPAAIVLSLLASVVNGKKPFPAFLLAGAGAALVLAVLRRVTVMNRGMVNAVILSISFLLSTIFLAVYMISRRDIEILCKKVVKAAGARTVSYTPVIVCAPACFLAAYGLQNLFLMPGDIILPGQSAFTTETLLAFTGMAAGIACIILLAAALYRAALLVKNHSAPCMVFWKAVVSAVILILMIRDFSTVIQFLTARRIIRTGRILFSFVAFILNNEMLPVFAIIVLSLLLPIAAIVITGRNNKTEFENPAQKRKHKALMIRNLRWNGLAILVIAFAEFSLTGLKTWNEKEVVLSPAEPMTVSGREILIPVAQIEDGALHRFAWNASDGTEVRFIVIKKSPSAYGVGFDACDICGNTGYYERKDGVVCRLCDVVMNKSTIGFKGGCNPVPLAYRVSGGAMAVSLDDLEAEKGRFK